MGRRLGGTASRLQSPRAAAAAGGQLRSLCPPPSKSLQRIKGRLRAARARRVARKARGMREPAPRCASPLQKTLPALCRGRPALQGTLRLPCFPCPPGRRLPAPRGLPQGTSVYSPALKPRGSWPPRCRPGPTLGERDGEEDEPGGRKSLGRDDLVKLTKVALRPSL